MGFEIKDLRIEEASPEGQILQRIVQREGVTPEEVLLRGLGRLAEEELSPAEQAWGAFSSPEDSALMDDAMEFVRENRRIESENMSQRWE